MWDNICKKKLWKKDLNSVNACEVFTLLWLNLKLSNSWKYPSAWFMNFAQCPPPCLAAANVITEFLLYFRAKLDMQGKPVYALLTAPSRRLRIFSRGYSFWRFKQVWNSSQRLICFYSYFLWKYQECVNKGISPFSSTLPVFFLPSSFTYTEKMRKSNKMLTIKVVLLSD